MIPFDETTNKFIVDDSEGYFKLHWKVLHDEDLSILEAVFLEYVIEVYPILKNTRDVDGLTYKRLSDSYIQEALDVTKPTIRKHLNKLEELGLIKIENANCKNGVRYIYLNVLNVRNRGKKSSTKETKNLRNKEPKNVRNEEDKKVRNEELENSSTHSSVNKLSLDYINNLDYSIDLKNSLINWFNMFINNPKFTDIPSIGTFNNYLSEIYKETGGDFNKIKRTIDTATEKGWGRFYYKEPEYNKKQAEIHTTNWLETDNNKSKQNTTTDNKSKDDGRDYDIAKYFK